MHLIQNFNFVTQPYHGEPFFAVVAFCWAFRQGFLAVGTLEPHFCLFSATPLFCPAWFFRERGSHIHFIFQISFCDFFIFFAWARVVIAAFVAEAVTFTSVALDNLAVITPTVGRKGLAASHLTFPQGNWRILPRARNSPPSLYARYIVHAPQYRPHLPTSLSSCMNTPSLDYFLFRAIISFLLLIYNIVVLFCSHNNVSCLWI